MVLLAGLCKIELPNRTIRLCDGAFVNWAGEQYNSSDDVFGTISEFIDTEDADDGFAPDAQLVFLPPENSPASILSSQTYQDSPVRFWVAEIDEQTGVVIGTPILKAYLLLDTSVMIYEESIRRLVKNIGSYMERYFLIDRANGLTERFHRSRYPNELGLNNAIGVTVQSAWGAATPPQNSGGSGSGGGFGGGIGRIAREVVALV